MTRNIVLLTIDSLRADHCGFLGCEYGTTPTLDALADEAIVFEHALAPGPRTPSSMPVIFTGEFFQKRNLGVYGSWEEKSSRWRERRARIRRHMGRFRALPQQLRDLGYTTAAVTANPWTTRATNFDEGFDLFHAVQENDAGRSNGSAVKSALGHLTGTEIDSWLLTWRDFADTISDLRSELPEPYFLWVFLLDPHQPYIAPREYRSENSAVGMYYSNFRYNYVHSYTDVLPSHVATRLRRAYRDTVRSVDGFVQRLRSELSDDDPILVAHSDHGEAFREHGTYGHRPQLYRENLHVPLLIHNAGRVERIEQPVSLRSLPSVLSSLASPNRTFVPQSQTSDFVLSKTEECEHVCVRNTEWAYISGSEGWEYVYALEPEELYHVQDDPDERDNVVEQYPEVAASLNALLSRHDRHQEEGAHITDSIESVTLRNAM